MLRYLPTFTRHAPIYPRSLARPAIYTRRANYKVTHLYDAQHCTATRGRMRLIHFYAMRLLDLLLIGMVALPLIPILAFIALLIKLDSRGPILFVQERVGSKPLIVDWQIVWRVQSFRMYKFRTMVHNADPTIHESYIKSFVKGTADASTAQEAKFKLVDDPRITRVGQILRRCSLDELPQLWNVLQGEMSLVGPRPVPTYEVDEYAECHYARLAARPGLTGLWQVKGRGNVSFDEMIQLDLKYVRAQTLWLNIKILALTVPAVFAGRGAV